MTKKAAREDALSHLKKLTKRVKEESEKANPSPRVLRLKFEELVAHRPVAIKANLSYLNSEADDVVREEADAEFDDALDKAEEAWDNAAGILETLNAVLSEEDRRVD